MAERMRPSISHASVRSQQSLAKPVARRVKVKNVWALSPASGGLNAALLSGGLLGAYRQCRRRAPCAHSLAESEPAT